MNISKYDNGFIDTIKGPIREIQIWDALSYSELWHAAVHWTVIIHDYSDEGWEGSGMALIKGKNGLWAYESLSHCSCYGPLEDDLNLSKFNKTLDECFSGITDSSEKIPEIYAIAKLFK